MVILISSTSLGCHFCKNIPFEAILMILPLPSIGVPNAGQHREGALETGRPLDVYMGGHDQHIPGHRLWGVLSKSSKLSYYRPWF